MKALLITALFMGFREVLVLDGATFSAKTDLIDGTNILPFQARYIALGQSVAGTANADATFKVQYL